MVLNILRYERLVGNAFGLEMQHDGWKVLISVASGLDAWKRYDRLVGEVFEF